MESSDRFLTYINSTVVDEIGWTLEVRIVYAIEAVLILSNWIEYVFVLYLMSYFRAMHRNLQVLIVLYGGQYVLSMISRSIIIYFQFIGEEKITNSSTSSVIGIANYCRTICLFTAFGIFPFFVFERMFATCFVGTYENNRHPWIPLSFISFLIPFNIFSAMAYIRSWIPVYIHCLGFMGINIGGSILLIIIRKCNVRLHNTYAKLENTGSYHYSLSQRFQVSENIKTCHWLSRIQVSILFFNIACSSILVLEYFTFNSRIMIIVYSAFNILCTIYAMTVPIVVIYFTPEWSREAVKLFNKICCRKTGVHPNLRSTFGEEMAYSDKNIESKMYFEQLQKALTKQTTRKPSQKKRQTVSYPNSSNGEHEIFL